MGIEGGCDRRVKNKLTTLTLFFFRIAPIFSVLNDCVLLEYVVTNLVLYKKKPAGSGGFFYKGGLSIFVIYGKDLVRLSNCVHEN